MFKRTGFFGGLWKVKNPHSLEHLKYLYNVLSKNQTVNDSNKSQLVETLRCIAEILIWGDQNDSSVFDFFLERNMLSFFLKIMDQKTGNNYVCVQLLQTLNILFENIRNETSIYYLLSNNHVNSIIIHKFDFSDEEVMAYYISFLKTLSFRLNKHTIHFFYNEHTHDFPLYTEAIKFFNHSESMVRIAVRTLTLNVYRVEDDAMLKFVTDKTAAPYFSNLVWFIGSHILDIDACVRNDADHQSLNKLKVLSDHLLNRLFIPLYMYSLARTCATSVEELKPFVSPVVALFLLCQVFLIITHYPLVRLLAWIIVAGDSEVFTERGATLYITSPSRRPRVKPSFMAPPDSLDKLLEANIRGTTSETDSDVEFEGSNTGSITRLTLLPSPFRLPSATASQSDTVSAMSISDEEKLRLAGVQDVSLESRPFLAALFQFLDHSDNDYIQLFALCLIYSMQINTGINKELLESVNIYGVNSRGKKVYNVHLMEKYIKLVTAGCQYGSRVRLVTLELLIKSIKIMVLKDGKSILEDGQFAALEGAREDSTLILRPLFRTPLTGIEFRKRLPCGEVERARRAIRTFFLLRDISLSLQGEHETSLPLSSSDSCVSEGSVLDLNNSDLLALTVEYKDGTKQRRFLVVDSLQIILIEPDAHRLGWGVSRYSGYLQDLEVMSDKEDSRKHIHTQ
ncbi:protein CLEC16A homolog [Eurytemora carolleeae]|uniref:protein CLEC16A homolog n=1 Tax=Eurytemora carolleeae TaxID=1294199 RepID=UPI000C78A8FB|nr:protein CLEC16A homolog [Eurytemora carolleeae]|eukprot:XP_023340885.1 protein CLEC16A homolog [Eurytemora affinis]